MHCHLEFHSESGMAMLFKVGDVEKQLQEAPPGWPQCGNYLSKEAVILQGNKSSASFYINNALYNVISFLLSFFLFISLI
jgi:hypothetical protein